jgi:hypothetical protein
MDHPCFRHIAGALQVEAGTLLASGRQHRRIELHAGRYTNQQIARLLAVRVACAACQCPVAPFRKRHGKAAGRAERPGRLFVSVACELGQNVGCARGKAASEATERLAAAIVDHRRAPGPLSQAPVASPAEPNQLGLRGLL